MTEKRPQLLGPGGRGRGGYRGRGADRGGYRGGGRGDGRGPRGGRGYPIGDRSMSGAHAPPACSSASVVLSMPVVPKAAACSAGSRIACVLHIDVWCSHC